MLTWRCSPPACSEPRRGGTPPNSGTGCIPSSTSGLHGGAAVPECSGAKITRQPGAGVVSSRRLAARSQRVNPPSGVLSVAGQAPAAAARAARPRPWHSTASCGQPHQTQGRATAGEPWAGGSALAQQSQHPHPAHSTSDRVRGRCNLGCRSCRPRRAGPVLQPAVASQSARAARRCAGALPSGRAPR